MPLESFEEPLAGLHERCERLVVLGTSRGAEAALLLGALHPEIDAVVAASRPRDVVWAGLSGRTAAALVVDPRRRAAAVRAVRRRVGAGHRPARVPRRYRAALEKYADRVPAARIPVERIAGEVVLIAGGDDRLWPSSDFADEVVDRRSAAGLRTELVSHPRAGHRVVLPGEQPRPASHLVHGGTPEADAALGALVWPHLEELSAAGAAEPTRN